MTIKQLIYTGLGDFCQVTVGPEFATYCEPGLTCVPDTPLLGSPGTCQPDLEPDEEPEEE